jgi:predicted RNA-binding protein (virulence factor B family)
MVQVGVYNTLNVLRQVDFGFYLDDDSDGILLPNRFAPPDLKIGDPIKVFLYHDGEGRIIATTESPKGIAGDIVFLKCVAASTIGAFLDWGLMKDLLVPQSQQLTKMHVGESYLVKIYVDELTNRVAATQKIERELSNEKLTVTELEQVHLIAQRKTDIGYVMIINSRHTGILHNNEIFRDIQIGDSLKGFVKKIILPDNKIDVVLGKPGYQKVEDELDKIMRLLEEHEGYLPYTDKSDPQAIYDFFGMSKKTFKMAIGALYKQRKIDLTKTGISLIAEE